MKIVTALAFAASMILIALGLRAGQIDADAGSWLLFVMPAIAVSLVAGSKCSLPFLKRRC